MSLYTRNLEPIGTVWRRSLQLPVLNTLPGSGSGIGTGTGTGIGVGGGVGSFGFSNSVQILN